MTLANKITITRFLLIPIMVVFMAIRMDKLVFNLIPLNQFIAAVIFTVASFTDF